MNVRTESLAERARRGAPFAAVALLAFLLLPQELRSPREPAVLAAVVLTIGIALAELLIPWHKLPRPMRGAPAFAFLVVVGLLRHAEGGGISVYSPLILLPIVWFALYGSRLELIAAVISAGAMFALSMHLFSGEVDSANEWRRALIAIAVSGLIGLVVQRLVAQLKHRSQLAEDHAKALGEAERRMSEQAANLAVVVEATRSLATVESAESVRTRICEAAVSIGKADVVMFLDPQASGESLRVTAGTVPELIGAELPLAGEPSGAAATFASATPLFAPRARTHPKLSKRLVEATDAQSVLFQPIIRDGTPVAVLCLVWQRLRPYLSERRMSLVELLANEATRSIERANLLSQLAELARTDELTGLPNRRVWDDTLANEIARAARSERPLTVAMIDLDHFKLYNDRNGHQAGDRLLKNAACAWQAQLRETDLLSRYGGEEFALVLPDCSLDSGLDLADRLRAVMPGDETCSIGIAEWDDSESAESLVQRADRALYKAKAAGRDCVTAANWLPAARYG